MNVLKHIEAIVIIAVAVTFSGAAIAKEPAPRAAKAPTVANSTKMIKVVITGKRLSKAEKAQLAAL